MGLYDFTFFEMIRRNGRLFGDRTAWIEAESGARSSFADLGARVERLAAGLQGCGVKKGQRIGVLAQNSLAYFLVYGAAAALGAIVLPINWRLSAEEALFNLEDGSPTVLLADGAYQQMLDADRSRLPSVRHRFTLAGRGDWPSLETLMQGGGLLEPVAVAADDGLVIIHTAAVAGRPRGALLSHANLLCANLHWQCRLQIEPSDVHLNLLPLFHVGGLFLAAGSFHAGALNINMRKFDAAQAAALIEAHRVSVVFRFFPDFGQHPGNRRSRSDQPEGRHRTRYGRDHRKIPGAHRRQVLRHVRSDRNVLHRDLRPL